jgi:ADP-heptose:LPS heptosyltransferase
LHDCFAIKRKIKETRPELIIDFERCSNTVSLFKYWLAKAGQSKTLSFDILSKKNNSASHLRFDANTLSFHDMLLMGIERMPISKSIAKKNEHKKNPKKVLVNINASDLLIARRYPLGSFHEMIVQLNNQYPSLTFYLTGSTNEQAYVENLINDLTGISIQVNNQAGLWTISQLVQELSQAALFITGDSGPLHLGIYLGTPTIAIWGPTQPQHFGYSDNDRLINVTRSLSCSPCFLHPQSKPAVSCAGKISCLNGLEPSQIVSAAINMLNKLELYTTPLHQ